MNKLLIVFMFSLLSCANKNSVNKTQEKMPEENNEENGYKKLLNDDKTLTLFLKVTENKSDPATTIDYYVIENANGKILRKEVYRGTSVEWGKGRNLILTPYVGMIKKEDEKIPDENAKTLIKDNRIIIKL